MAIGQIPCRRLNWILVLICTGIRERKNSENFLSTKITFQAEYGCTSVLALLHYMYIVHAYYKLVITVNWNMGIPRENTNWPHFITSVGGKALYIISIQRNLYKEKSQNFICLMDILLLELHYTVGQLEGHRGIHVITKIIDHTLSQFVGGEFY